MLIDVPSYYNELFGSFALRFSGNIENHFYQSDTSVIHSSMNFMSN